MEIPAQVLKKQKNIAQSNSYSINSDMQNFFSVPVEYYSINKISKVQKQVDYSKIIDIALLNAIVDIENEKKQ